MTDLEMITTECLDKRDNLITTAEELEKLISDTSGSKVLEKRVAAFLDEFFDFMAIEKKYLLSLHDAHERFIIDLTGLSFDELVSLSSPEPEA